MPSIAIDFDEVLANSMEYALSKHNTLYPNSHLSSSDITTFSWERIEGCRFHTYQESVEFWRSTLNEASFDYITPIE
jgi:5'(3')-deoxyribonucleotidase